MYLTESSSPFVPGARPSNSSDARTLMCASKPSGVIASSAGCNRSASSSAARSHVAAAKEIVTNQRAFFITYGDLGAAFVSNAERTDGCVDWRSRERAPRQLSRFLRWARGRFLFILWADADLFQERLDGLFAAEELFDGDRNIARIARLVDFA